MTIALSPQVRLSASIRLVLAMFRLYADIETGFGKAVLDILKKQYPDQNVDINPSTVGHKLMNISRKQNQNDDQRSMDSIQDFLTYISVGANGGKGWDFPSQTADTWQKALDAIYSNVRSRSMSKSMENSRRKKKEKSVDDAFGKRGEGGGAPEGGEAHMPTTDETNLGKALDDKAAAKEFIDLIDSYVPDLKASLSPACRVLFDLIFDDEVGGFGSDIKDNMGQASALEEKLKSGTPDQQAIFEKNAKRWSGFVGDTRKKLLEEIWDFIDEHMSKNDFQVLRDTFFSDTTPESVDKLEKKKEQDKIDYQRGIDERKLARFKGLGDKISPKDKKSMEALEKKLQDAGVDTSKIAPVAPSKDKEESDPQQSAQAGSFIQNITKRLAARTWNLS